MSEELLKNFALLAASEGGVAKLRELILSLAVRGKLVLQDPKDEPASELLKRIRAEKERLVAEGKIKREKPLPTIGKEEKPFELPEAWEWVRLSQLCGLENGDRSSTYPSKGDFVARGVPFINAGHLVGRRINFTEMNFISEERFDRLRSGKIVAGDILYCLRGSLGKIALVGDGETGAIASSLVILRRASQFQAGYAMLYLSSPLAAELITRFDNGTAQPNLGANDLAKFVAPLPPLPEQSRIVAKVEALMDLCDRLEAQQGDAARVQARWTQAALDQLAESGDADEFARNWQALAEHFDTLFATPASIDALDATLLQLAVRGKLVPQNPADEPANELLKKIRAEKDRLIATGQIKRDKPLLPIADDEKQFELPVGWAWARMQEVFDVRDGTHDTPKYVDSDGVPLITSRNFCNGRISFADAKLISWQDHGLIKMRSAVAKGDILYSMIGGNIGNQVMVDTDREFSIKNVALFKYYQTDITPPRYLNIFLRTVTISLQSKAVGGAQPFVSLSLLRNIPFALPPTSEQSRIVAKLDELLALTRTLRTRIKDARAVQARLASALVDEVATC